MQIMMSRMNFSDGLRITSGLFLWSPDGKFCAIATTARLEIREGYSLSLFITFNCLEYIQSIEWSPDSSLVYVANFKRGLVEVFQPQDPSWKCKIDEGAIGLVKLSWSPDSRHLLTTSEFHLRLTVWSLISKSVTHIKYPKEANPGIQFSHDGDYVAVAERKDCKDLISIYETKSWIRVKNFDVGTRDLGGLQWAPDDSVLAIWDTPVEYRVCIYTITGQCLASYSAYQWALGVKRVAWSPLSPRFLAIGSYDQTVRLMNHISWKISFEFSHTSTVDDEECVIYKEKEKPLSGYPATLAAVHGSALCLETSYEEEKTRPVNLAHIPAEVVKKANPKVGVGLLEFSSDGRFMVTRIDDMPATVWVWNVTKLSLAAVLVHCSPVKDLQWCPKRPCLAICTGGNHLYMWTPFGSLSVAVPNLFTIQISSLRWHPTGGSIALIGKEKVSICYLNSPNTIESEDKDDQAA